ncbi:hypothetical protein OBBRIDRAFT_795284 [Obba rivulosa]|uniref:F-box domain-containing protein n=1 Tax=Obba rivulosa TaxID=1052685 RepID=A0A8E2DK09_9APHY|nr:hypothetical protein OBBRIDRAFT_795284 [Obba rivulosa]
MRHIVERTLSSSPFQLSACLRRLKIAISSCGVQSHSSSCPKFKAHVAVVQQSGTTLPIETWEHILDFVADPIDRQSILACALVCQAWLPRSRHYLFGTVHLRTAWQLLRLGQTLHGSAHLSCLVNHLVLCPDHDATALLAAAENLLPQLPATIQLTIQPFLHFPSGTFLPSSGKKPRRNLRGLARKAIKWRRIRADDNAFPLSEVTVITPLYTLDCAHTAYASITTLHLYNSTFLDFSGLASILRSLPNLLRLHCNGTSWNSWNLLVDPLDDAKHHDVGLKELTHLDLRFRFFPSAGLEHLIGALGTPMQVLKLSTLMGSQEQEQAARCLDFKRCRSLDTIFLGSWIHCLQCDYTWMISTLSSVSSDQVQQVEIKFALDTSTLDRREVLDRIPFSNFDDVLSSPQFAGVAQFVFEFEDASERRQWWISELATRMPMLQFKGKLRLELQNLPPEHTWRDESLVEWKYSDILGTI